VWSCVAILVSPLQNTLTFGSALLKQVNYTTNLARLFCLYLCDAWEAEKEHTIELEKEADVDDELLGWLKDAYELSK
jgi:hypothetical protein